jgi:sulfide dehydrogenase cytochrome subunit
MLLAGLLAAPLAWAEEPSPGMLAGTCSSCHGIDGNSQGPASPTIAGLSEDYFIGAMLSYKYAEDIDKAWDLIERDPELGNVIVLKRSESIMDPLAQGYTVSEIKAMARYFAGKPFEAPYQAYDARSASRGQRLHDAFCEKCHEDGGASADEDAGRLAGQWELYLWYALNDYRAGHREQTTQMAVKMSALAERKGDQGFRDLIEYYISQNGGRK